MSRLQNSAEAGCQNCQSIVKGIQLWAAANNVEYDDFHMGWMEDRDCLGVNWRPLHAEVEFRVMRGRGRQIEKPLRFDLIMYVHESKIDSLLQDLIIC
jgi:hypothetical protein